MLVQAKHNINFRGTWYAAGDKFEATRADMDELYKMVYVIEQPRAESDAKRKPRNNRQTEE